VIEVSSRYQRIITELVPQIRKNDQLMPMFVDSENSEVTCDDCGNETLVYEWITINGDTLNSRPWQCGSCIIMAHHADPVTYTINVNEGD
jgi:hypothetical protein